MRFKESRHRAMQSATMSLRPGVYGHHFWPEQQFSAADALAANLQHLRNRPLISTAHSCGKCGLALRDNFNFCPVQWITKEEHDEFGPSIVHRMCF